MGSTTPYRYNFLADCPTRLAIDLIANTWTIIVVHALRHGPQRPKDLQRQIGGISPKVLTETLRRLERRRLVKRQAYTQAPPRVDYDLTPLGRSLLVPLEALADWVQEHGAEVGLD